MRTTIDHSMPMSDIVGKLREKIDEKVLGVIETIAPHNYFARRDEARALIGEYVRIGHVTPQHSHMLYEAVRSKSLEVGKKMNLGNPAVQSYIPKHHQHAEVQSEVQLIQPEIKPVIPYSQENKVTINFGHDQYDGRGAYRKVKGLAADMQRQKSIGVN